MVQRLATIAMSFDWREREKEKREEVNKKRSTRACAMDLYNSPRHLRHLGAGHVATPRDIDQKRITQKSRSPPPLQGNQTLLAHEAAQTHHFLSARFGTTLEGQKAFNVSLFLLPFFYLPFYSSYF